MVKTLTVIRSLEPKYRKGQTVHITRPDEAATAEAKHLIAFAGQSVTINDIVGARFSSREGLLGASLYHVSSADKKKVLVPEGWLAPS